MATGSQRTGRLGSDQQVVEVVPVDVPAILTECTKMPQSKYERRRHVEVDWRAVQRKLKWSKPHCVRVSVGECASAAKEVAARIARLLTKSVSSHQYSCSKGLSERFRTLPIKNSVATRKAWWLLATSSNDASGSCCQRRRIRENC